MNDEYVCKYCLDEINPTSNDVISPCNCRGSMNYVHKKCFNKVNRSSCEICKIDYPNRVILYRKKEINYTVICNYIIEEIDKFYRNNINTQINIVNDEIYLGFKYIYDKLYNNSISNKCIFILNFLMLWTFLKYFTLGYFAFLTSYIFIINIISLVIGNYYSNILQNIICSTLRYIQYHLVYNIYKSKDIIVNIFKDPISIILIFLEFKYFFDTEWNIPYEILCLYNLILFGYIFLQIDNINTINNYINRQIEINRGRLYGLRMFY